MRRLILAAMLGVSSMALAQTEDTTQDTTTEEMETQETTTQVPPPEEPMPAQPPAPMPPAPTTGETVAPSNANPERDARGIPVVSDAATAPPGANQPVSVPPGATVVPSANQSAVFSTQPGEAEYPACSKTVTDNCVQTYERGRSPK